MTRPTTLPEEPPARGQRGMRAWPAILAFGFALACGCTSPGEEGGDDADRTVDASSCAALREHLIGLQPPGPGATPAQRAAYLRALGDELAASCQQSATGSAPPDGPRATSTRPR